MRIVSRRDGLWQVVVPRRSDVSRVQIMTWGSGIDRLHYVVRQALRVLLPVARFFLVIIDRFNSAWFGGGLAPSESFKRTNRSIRRE